LGNLSTIPIGIVLPKPVSYTRPMYTDEARRRGIEGVVTVEATFDVDGTFKILRVVKGLGYGLDESAQAAVKKWRFAPAYQNGQRVSVVTQIDVNFSLFDDPQWLREQNLPAELGKRKWGIESIRSTAERSGE
jgi:TonB family protein